MKTQRFPITRRIRERRTRKRKELEHNSEVCFDGPAGRFTYAYAVLGRRCVGELWSSVDGSCGAVEYAAECDVPR